MAYSRTTWTAAEIEYLCKHYPDMLARDVACALNKTTRSVYLKAGQMGLKKSDAFFNNEKSGRLTANTGLGTRFKKGLRPWNKGMKGLQQPGRCKETQFKPGHLGGSALKNVKPVGYERLTKDGYIERKIRADGPFYKRWRAVHILNWEAVNGPLPDGHCLVFKDGNKQNLALDNLVLTTRADNMRRNTYHNYPKEIALAIQARGALIRRINNEHKKHQ